MDSFRVFEEEFQNRQIIESETTKMVNLFEEINVFSGKKSKKFIDKHKFRSFLKNYEMKNLINFTLHQRSLIIQKFYKYFRVPFFEADFKNLDKNVKKVLNIVLPLIINIESIPKKDITFTINKNLDEVIEEIFREKDKEEKILMKQLGFRYLFESFLPELRASPENALFVNY
jgi:hypothetical protein